MSEQRKNASSGTRGKPDRFRRLTLTFLAFFAGAVCMHVTDLIFRKSELMGHPYKLVKLFNLASVTRRSLGFGHLRSCEGKVQRLHDVLASKSLTDDAKTEEIEIYLASILIDGRSCNEFLVQHLNCHQELPPFGLFSEIRSVFIFDMNYAPLLKDEQGLMLFLLHRINPEALLFSPEYFYECENTTAEGRRAFLVSEWNYLYGEDAPAGIFERLRSYLTK